MKIFPGLLHFLMVCRAGRHGWIYLIITLVFSGFYTIRAEDKTEMIEKYKKELMQTDRDFCRMAKEKGVGEAFIFYAADDVIRLKNNKPPNLNKEELSKDFMNFDPEKKVKLTWEPVKADAAESGDLGYTFGYWIIQEKDEKGVIQKNYGDYVTVWKKQKDGSWKYVLDGGTSTPPPAE